MGRAPCCDKANVKRGPWSPEEDAILKSYIDTHGTGGNWMALPTKAGLRRCGKSCRLRWLNYLRPDIRHGGFTDEEDNLIGTLYSQMGSRWSVIASKLPGRTDNDVKNYWNTKLKKKLLAGNIGVTPSKSDKIPTNGPTHISSTLGSLPYVSKAETHFLVISASQTENPPAISSGLSANFHSLTSDHPTQVYCPQLIDVSEFGSSSKKDFGINVSLSQESSSISNWSSIDLDKYVSWAGNGEIYDPGALVLDTGFGAPYGLNSGGLWFPQKASEIAPPCYATMDDFLHADIKPQGVLDPGGVIGQY